MRTINDSSGHTLIEMLVSVGVVTLVLTCAMSMMIGAMSSFEDSTVQSHTDSDAVIAMQKIVSRVREAKSFNLIANSTRLRLIFPEVTTEGYYNRQKADMAHQIDFYLSDESGAPGQDGHYLWEGKNNNNRRIVARNIESLEFAADDAAETRAIVITIVARNPTSNNGTQETRLTERVVYLRNY